MGRPHGAGHRTRQGTPRPRRRHVRVAQAVAQAVAEAVAQAVAQGVAQEARPARAVAALRPVPTQLAAARDLRRLALAARRQAAQPAARADPQVGGGRARRRGRPREDKGHNPHVLERAQRQRAGRPVARQLQGLGLRGLHVGVGDVGREAGAQHEHAAAGGAAQGPARRRLAHPRPAALPPLHLHGELRLGTRLLALPVTRTTGGPVLFM